MKRIFAFLLAFMMLVAFASCGSKDEDAKTGKSENIENKQKLNSYIVEGYEPIEATNDEGKIIAALDKTLFGTRSLKASLKEDGYDIFDGYVDFGKTLASSGLYFDVEGGEISGAVYDGALIVTNDDVNEYITADVEKIAGSNEEELNSFLVEFTGHSADEWIEELKNFGIEINAPKLLGWVEKIVDGRINEDVVAEIFDEVAIPYVAAIVSSYGYSVEASDIPDFKTLKGILYDFFLEGHASSALTINADCDRYSVTVNVYRLVKSARDYVSGHEKLQALVNSKLGQNMLQMIDEEISYAEEYEEADYDISFALEITDGFISRIEIEDVTLELSDFNEFTEIKEDYDELVDESSESELIYSANSLSDLAELY